MLVREAIGRLRLDAREHLTDNYLSNKYLFSILLSSLKLLLIRESKKQIFKSSDLWTKKCIKMMEVPLESCGFVIPSDCTIYRSVDKLGLLDTDSGPLYKTLGSLDYSTQLLIVTPTAALNKKKLKYSTNKFAWIVDDYLYTLEDYPFYNLEGYFVEYNCNLLDSEFKVLSNLEDPLFKLSLETILRLKQIPPDLITNKSLN